MKNKKSMAMVLSIAIIFSSFGVLANAQSDNTNEVIQMPLPITQDEGLKKQPKDEDLMAELIQPSETATPLVDSNIDVKAATGEVDAGLSQVGTNGYTNETIERYKDFKYADPNYITDEIFFGKWNKNTLKWDKEPYLNYDNGTLIEAEKEVKNGDYKAAKEKTLAYYREKFINQPRKYPTNVSRIQKLTADFESYNLFFNKATGIDATDLVTVPKNGGYVQMNILEDTQKAAKSPGQQERNYILVAIEKDGTLANFNTKENSDNKPYVEATVNGVKKRFPIVKDTMVSPDSNKAKNYGSEPIISVEESNSSITEKIDGVKPIDSNTKRVYVNVDFSGLGSGDDITESYLYMYGSTNNPNGKKIGVLTNINANMVENTFTWGSTEHLLFSYDGESGPKWDWAANGAGLNYMGYRFNEEQNRFENFASCMSNSYKATGDEVYAYHMLRLMLNFYQKRGQNPGYRNNLDLGCRAQSFPILMATFIDSEFMTPEVFTPLLKSCWQLANQLIVNWNKMSLNSNHGAYETMGLSVIAINMNEFNDATKPLESGATPENGGRGGWLDVAGYRFAAMCNKNILADGSGIECSLGYTSETAGNTIRQLSVAKDAGWYDFKLSEAVKEAITKSGKYMVSATGPGFRDFQQGDSQVNDHSYLGSIKSIANEVDDPILKWAATDGKEGKAPDYTSILYPVGRKVILRSGWGNDDIYISSNADGNMGGHGHSDDMVLNMFAYGKYLLADPRYINYDTDNPYRTWQISSRGHNVVEINGFSQKGGGFGWTYGKPIKGPSGENLYMSSGNKYGNIRDSELNGTYDFVKLNSPNNLGIKAVDDKGKAISSSVDYDRDILFLKSGHVIVTDSLKPVDKMGSNNYSLGWHYMPDANVTINPETNVVRTNFNAEANINVAAVSPQSEQVTTIKDGWYSYSTGNVISAKYSSSVKDVAGDTSMNTLLVPEKPGAKTDVLTSDIPLDVDDGAATAFSFLINNKSENSTIDGSYYSVLNPKNQTQRSFGKYTTDGSLALCETENNSYLQLALRNGTNLTSTADNIKLIRASEKIKDVGVNYLASKIDINSAKDINLENIQLYSGNKKISEVRLNGKAVSFKQDKQKGDIYFGATMPFLGNEIENTHSPDNPGGGTGGGNHATGGGNGSGGGVIPPTPTQAPGTTEKPSDKFSAELKNHWGKIEISEMVDLGIVKGVSDTSLGLLDNTTRAEFMAMCLRSKNIKLDEYNGEFKDVFGDEWYAPYIATAKNLGILEGDGVNASPNAFVTRAEMAKILVKFYEMNGDIIKPNPKSLEKFSDLSNIEDWKKVYIEKAITAKFMNGVTESMFEPDANALREQAIVVLYRMLKAKA